MSEIEEIECARKLLESADVFYETRAEMLEWNTQYPEGHIYHDEDDRQTRTLNMNDTFAWALAYGEIVSDEEMIEVAKLFKKYGYNGLNYWCAKKAGFVGSEFHDVTRGMEFVKKEEELIKEIPDSSKRAYHKTEYTLGSD